MPDPTRRAFLQLTASVPASFVIGAGTRAEDQPPRVMTFTYKTIGDCPIQADVHGAQPGARRPVLVWIHGGALIMGHRGGIDRALAEALNAAGVAVVSIDYRLAPETKLPAIIEDVRDACRWVREKGGELFGADPDRLAVAGGSAGGYLTLVSGYRVEPRPRALVSYWGYGDIAGAWYSRPDEFYRRSPLVPESEARAAVGTKPISEASGQNDRFRFYLYCRQQGLWPKEVAGHDPDSEPRDFDPFCPVRNVTKDYPPTLLVHGTADTDVPYEQSKLMDAELTRHGVEHELITVPGGGHGLGNADRAEIARIRSRVVAFLTDHLKSR
jgi:acetyl esterase/lipase